MKALVKTATGVQLQALAQPVIERADHVLVKIAAAGLCRTDIAVADGIIETSTPRILGHEFSGVVQQVGQEVADIKVGDHVTANPLLSCGHCAFCDNGAAQDCTDKMMLGLAQDGAFAEFICLPAAALHVLPPSLSFLLGAYTEPVAASLAVLNAPIKPEQTGLIYGRNRIADLTLLILRAHGFSHVTIEAPLAFEKNKDRANSYDFIIETLATSETMHAMQDMIKPGGTIILKSRQPKPVMIDINKAVLKNVTFHAVHYGSFSSAIDLLASNKLDVSSLFGASYTLDRYADMFELGRRAESKKLFFVMN